MSQPITVKDALEAYLKVNGYDGLCNPEVGCGCVLVDLCPCESDFSMCEPGYLCDQNCETCNEDCDCRDDGGWMILLHPQKKKEDKNDY